MEAPWTQGCKNNNVTSMGGFEGGAGSLGEASADYEPTIDLAEDSHSVSWTNSMSLLRLLCLALVLV